MEAADSTTTITTTTPITHAFSMRTEKQQYDIRESFSPDLVLQRRLQESQQSMHFNDGMTSARFNNYQESEEESSRRRRNKRIKPRALEVSDFSAGRGQNSTSRNNSNLNSQRNFLNSHRTNQSGLSSRGGNSMQNSGNGEMLSSTVVKDKHAERSEMNSNCVSPFSAREVKAAQSAYLSNIEEVSEKQQYSKRQQYPQQQQQQQQQQCSGMLMHQQRNYSNDESNHVISPISPGINSQGIRDYPEFQLLTQSEQYQRHGYSSDGSTRARKLVSQPSLRQFNQVNTYDDSRQKQQLQQSYQHTSAILERKNSVYGIECEEELRASGDQAFLNEVDNLKASSNSSSRLYNLNQNTNSRLNQQHLHVQKQSQGQIDSTQQQFYQHPQQQLTHFNIQQQQQKLQYIDQTQAQGLNQTWQQQYQQDYQQSKYQQNPQDQEIFQLSYANVDANCSQYPSTNHLNRSMQQQHTQLDQQYIPEQGSIISNQHPSSSSQYYNQLQRLSNHSDRHIYQDELGSSITAQQDIQNIQQSNSNRTSQERNTKNHEDNFKNIRNSIGPTKVCGIISLPIGNSSLKITSEMLNASGQLYTEEHGDRLLAVSRQNTLETMSNSGMRKQGLDISSLEISNNNNHNNERYLDDFKEDEDIIDANNAEMIVLKQTQNNNQHNKKIKECLSLKQSQQSLRSSKSPLRECTQRLNNSMGELTGVAGQKNEQYKIYRKDNNSIGNQKQNTNEDAKNCRVQQHKDGENDSDKENVQQSSCQVNNFDKLSGSQQLRAKPRASSSFKSQPTIDQAEYEQIFKLLIHERDKNSNLENQLRENNQTIHLLRQTIAENINISQSQRNYENIILQNEGQIQNLQRTAEELKQQLQEQIKNNQQILQEKLLLVEQNTQLLENNRELKRRSQEIELKGKVLERERQNANSQDRKKEQDAGNNKDKLKISSIIDEQQQAVKHSNSNINNNGCTFQTEDETGNSNNNNNISSQVCSTAYKTNQSSFKTTTTGTNAATITSSNFYKGSQNTNTHSSINNTNNNAFSATPSNTRRVDGNRCDEDADIISQNQQSFLDISYTKKPKSPRNNNISHSSETSQFVACVLGMVEQCAPAGQFTENQPNNLKRSWKILKQIMENYIVLKKNALTNVNNLEILCQSAKVLGLENVDMLPNALVKLVERSSRDRLQCKVYQEKLRQLQHALSYIQENQCNIVDFDTAEDRLDTSSFSNQQSNCIMKRNIGKDGIGNSLGIKDMDYLNNENQQRLELKRQQKNQVYGYVDKIQKNERDQEEDTMGYKSNQSHGSHHMIDLDNSQDGNFTFKLMKGIETKEKKATTPRAGIIQSHSPNNNSFITNDLRSESINNNNQLSRVSKQHQNSGNILGRHSNKQPSQHQTIDEILDHSLIDAVMTNQNGQGQLSIRRKSQQYSPADGQTISNKVMVYNQQNGRITEKQQYPKVPSQGFQQFQEEHHYQHNGYSSLPQRHWQLNQQQEQQQVLNYELEDINRNIDNNTNNNSSFHNRRQSSASPLARPPTHKQKQTTLKNTNSSNNNSFMV